MATWQRRGAAAASPRVTFCVVPRIERKVAPVAGAASF